MPPTIKIESQIRLTGHNASIFALAQGGVPHLFYAASGDGWIVEWNLQSPDLGRLVAEAPEQVFSLCYLPKTKGLVAGTMNGQVNWINLEEPEKTRRLEFHKQGVYDIKLMEDSVYTLGGDGLISKWDIESHRPLESLQLSGERLRSLAWSAARNELAVGASDGHIYLLDWAKFSLRDVIRDAHQLSAFSLVYTPDGNQLISGGRDAMLRKWNLDATPKLQLEVPAHRYTINDLVLDPRGVYLASASRDRTVKIWDIQTLELLKVLEGPRDQGHLNSVNRLLWSGYENRLISASDDRTLIVWEVR
ncbi:MAG: WD40 repeat domain-containing protein [Saprospiraceae bacterium]|nr:WD40 repeat domain-containing protein [Saprospiraceae bacterium]